MKGTTNLLIITGAFIALLTLGACQRGAQCPAYNSVHNTRNHGFNPNNKKRKEENNKKDVEARKKAELEAPPKRRRKKSYTLFPK